MIKAFLGQYKMYFYGALAVGLFLAGWSVNGWRLNAKIEKLNAAHTKQVLETERIAHDLVAETEARSLANIEAVRKERDNAIQSLKKLRGVTIDGRIIGVLSDYTKTTGSASDTQDDTRTAEATYDAEEQTRIIIENYAKFNECRQQVIEFNQFYDSLLKEFNR
jgi:hypothetical protein